MAHVIPDGWETMQSTGVARYELETLVLVGPWPNVFDYKIRRLYHDKPMKAPKILHPAAPTSPAKVLSKSVRVYAKQIASDPHQAAAFLKRAGIITASGKLSSKYR